MDEMDSFLTSRRGQTLQYLKDNGFDARYNQNLLDKGVYSIDVRIKQNIEYDITVISDISDIEVDLISVFTVDLQDVDISLLLAHKLMNEYEYLKVFVTYNSKTDNHAIVFRVQGQKYDLMAIKIGLTTMSHSIKRYHDELCTCRHLNRDQILLDLDG